MRFGLVITVAMAVVCWTGCAMGADPTTMPAAQGGRLFAEHCATCHGTFGDGDGPMAPSLSVTLNNLRYLSQRNDGEFPRRFVANMIDGRDVPAAHRPEGMPVWGEVFTTTGGDAGQVEAAERIGALVAFLEAVQVADPR